MKKLSLKMMALILILMQLSQLQCSEPKIRDGYPPNLILKVYKTRADYFNYVNTWNGTTSAPATRDLSDTKFIGVVNGDTVYLKRQHLSNNYVLAGESSENDFFTDISFAELVRYNEDPSHESTFPLDSIFSRVIDTDPFLEYYKQKEDMMISIDSSTVPFINELIEQDQLEVYFDRIK